MKSALYGAYTYAEFGAVCVAFLPVMGVSAAIHRGDATQRLPGRWMRRLGRTAVRLSPLWSFSVEGERPVDIDHRGYVVVANHESAADPFLLSFLPWDMRWVAKQELFRVPLVGQLMQLSGDIPLRRGQRDSVTEMLRECRRTLDAGMSVMMFPEGTRSSDGSILPFKPGAFDLAIAASVPILPIAIDGTRACRPKGSRWFGEAHATARILPPIETARLSSEDARDLAERTRRAIATSLGRTLAEGKPREPLATPASR